MNRVSYKCPTCGQEYVACYDDRGRLQVVETADGEQLKKCQFCRGALLPTNILESARKTENSAAKTQLAIVNTMTNIAASGGKDPNQILSLGMFYLIKGGYDDAILKFDEVISLAPDCAEAYSYRAMAKLKGRKPFVLPMPVIREIEEDCNMAEAFSEGDYERIGLFKYFHAYVEFDFYKRKFLKEPVPYKSLLQYAEECGLTDEDAADLFAILKQPVPPEIRL